MQVSVQFTHRVSERLVELKTAALSTAKLVAQEGQRLKLAPQGLQLPKCNDYNGQALQGAITM